MKKIKYCANGGNVDDQNFSAIGLEDATKLKGKPANFGSLSDGNFQDGGKAKVPVPTDKKENPAATPIRKPIPGTKQQYQAYQDSLDLYNFYELQKDLDRSSDVNTDLSFKEKLFGGQKQFLPEGQRRQAELFNKAQDYLIRNPNLKTGLHSLPTSTKEQYREKGSYDIYQPNIKPKGEWMGSGKNSEYVKPVQPIIYQPEEDWESVARKKAGLKFDGSGTSFAQVMIDSKTGKPIGDVEFISGYDRPKQQPINIQSSKPDLLQGTNNLEFNPIPYKQGSYFTREQQGQEVGGKEYFDKVTGKKLNQGGMVKKIKYCAAGGYVDDQNMTAIGLEDAKKLKAKPANFGNILDNQFGEGGDVSAYLKEKGIDPSIVRKSIPYKGSDRKDYKTNFAPKIGVRTGRLIPLADYIKAQEEKKVAGNLPIQTTTSIQSSNPQNPLTWPLQTNPVSQTSGATSSTPTKELPKKKPISIPKSSKSDLPTTVPTQEPVKPANSKFGWRQDPGELTEAIKIKPITVQGKSEKKSPTMQDLSDDDLMLENNRSVRYFMGNRNTPMKSDYNDNLDNELNRRGFKSWDELEASVKKTREPYHYKAKPKPAIKYSPLPAKEKPLPSIKGYSKSFINQ